MVVFDPATVIDRATYDDPEQPPAGLPHVLVNRIFDMPNGEYTDARSGRVLLACARTSYAVESIMMLRSL